MNKRNLLIVFVWVLCLGTVWGVLTQRQQLKILQAGPKQNSSQPAVISPPSAETEKASNGAVPTTEVDLAEILRLRSEITRLHARKRELAGVAEEGDRLRAQLANAQTDPKAGTPLPARYIRKAQAHMAGFSTPEYTLQSFLWAVQHHNVTTLLDCVSPSEAQSLSSRLRDSPEQEKELFKGLDQLPGMAIQSKQSLPDGSVELQVIIAPGIPPQPLQLQQISGQWRFTTLRF